MDFRREVFCPRFCTSFLQTVDVDADEGKSCFPCAIFSLPYQNTPNVPLMFSRFAFVDVTQLLSHVRPFWVLLVTLYTGVNKTDLYEIYRGVIEESRNSIYYEIESAHEIFGVTRSVIFITTWRRYGFPW